ncbi:PAS domain S-box protein [Poseidonibacter antarcticus]|uniref:PAS domain S-box protein n=1 Tax=Poseidonibacter antarcticus TaxID=2478538 RepID=UPI000EF4C4C3|nr:PAS domain S-box protein [Poseidonibacter antarcticus]
MRNILTKDINLIIFGSLIILAVIIVGIVSSSEILKKETINNQLTISKLNGKFLAENLNQNMQNVELFIENIRSLINLKEPENIINNKLFNSLDRFPIIRSVNILDKNKIIYSSNKLNIGLEISDNDFFPKPLFSNNILRVSTPWIGRDFISGSTLLSKKDIPDYNLSFIPILKNTYINKREFTVIINLNTDFILNRFKERSANNKFKIILSRTDNQTLLSNYQNNKIGQIKQKSTLLKDAFEFDEATGIEKINGKKLISTYNLTKDYPFIISLHLNYKESLSSWNEKSYKFFIISISIVVMCMLVVLILILIYKKEKEKEISLHRQQLEDQEKFKRLFHDSHFMAAVIDKDGKILDINNSGLEFTKNTAKETIGYPFWDIGCWRYEEQEYLKELLTQGNTSVNIKQEIDALDSSKKDAILEITIYTINKNTKNYKYIAIGQDITQRKEKEKKLLQSYTVFNNTRDGIMITDKDTNILDVNNAFEFITGYSKKEILGENTRILKSNLHDKEFYDNLWTSLKENNYWEGEIINYRKDKTFYTEWLTINAILGKDKEVVNYIGIFSDVTKEKEKEILLKEKESVIYQQSKMASMGEMIENIAHQWRQPLSVISTAATGIKVQKKFNSISEEDEIQSLDLINESAQYLSATIDDFRHFLRNDKEFKEFTLEDSLSSAIKLISSKLKNRNIIIIKDIEDIEIFGLRNEFIQVIINIINNAKDALEETQLANKYIFINSYTNKKSVIVEIKNNGGKIPPKIINRIFEPYFTTKHQSQGTGIGLYMSTEIITKHMKGLLSVTNEEFTYNKEQFSGPCFKIEIPI